MSELPFDREVLREAITKHFSEEELKTLCFDLEIDYENLPNMQKDSFVREILQNGIRKGSWAVVVQYCQRKRPDVDWQAIIEPPPDLPSQGKEYVGNREAFLDAEKLMVRHVEWCANNNVPAPQIDIKIIAVAMTFSWPFFIESMPRILDSYESTSIHLEALFVEHTFLDSLPLANYGVNWARVSKFQKEQMRGFASTATTRFGARLTMTARNYQNLPHWHGILINEEHLFLGRSNWNFPNGRPELTVGQNTYRYFNTMEKQGDDRVELFLNWHKFYSEFNSKLICSIPALEEFLTNEHEKSTDGLQGGDTN